MKDSLFILVNYLLKKNKINHDKKELSFQIKSHPSYPSLHAITGVLDHFNIENIAVNVPANLETVEQLPNCFLAQIEKDNIKSLIVITKINDDFYEIFDSNSKKSKITKNEFIKLFTGIIIVIEKNSDIVYERKNSNVLLLISLLVVIFSSAYLYYKSYPTLYSILLVILSIFGIIISISILKQEEGLNSFIGNAFCSSNNDKKDCDAVLSSKGAEIITNHKLSDICLLYFSCLTLMIIFIPRSILLKGIILSALLSTMYSIYYQFAIIKKWCLLCLSIVGILWLQGAILYFNEGFTSLKLSNIVISILIISSVYTFWSYIKPRYQDLINLRAEHAEDVKFKRNFDLFNSILQKSKQYNDTKIDEKEIIFGNEQSHLEILVITNPFCGHCEPVHEAVHKILTKYDNDVKIIIRFNVSTDEDSYPFKVTRRLIEIYETEGKKACLTAMDSIYNDKKFDIWISEWKGTKDKEFYSTIIKAQKHWCTKNEINFTPEILINGKSYPKEYRRKDIFFFIEDLLEYTSPPQNTI